MNKLHKAFEKGKAFIPFITAGDPTLEVTENLIYAMEQAGVDLIEIGIPFSDPVAEGVVIQQASERALAGGTTLEKIFGVVARVRSHTEIPLAFMTYYNPVFSYGGERFICKAAELGVDAVIIPDLPFEESDELREICRKHSVRLISMIAPTSGDRIDKITEQAEGFVYCVSSLGVTGERNAFYSGIQEMIARVKAVKDIPCAVGFGVSTPEQAMEMCTFADGVISGSAIVKLIGQHKEAAVPVVADFVRRMKAAILNSAQTSHKMGTYETASSLHGN